MCERDSIKSESEYLINKLRNPQEGFNELNPYEKADFMRNNIKWATCGTLEDEIKMRNNPNISEDEE